MHHTINQIVMFHVRERQQLFHQLFCTGAKEYFSTLKSTFPFPQTCFLVLGAVYNLHGNVPFLQHTRQNLTTIVAFYFYERNFFVGVQFMHAFAKFLFIFFRSCKFYTGHYKFLYAFVAGNSKRHWITAGFF